MGKNTFVFSFNCDLEQKVGKVTHFCVGSPGLGMQQLPWGAWGLWGRGCDYVCWTTCGQCTQAQKRKSACESSWVLPKRTAWRNKELSMEQWAVRFRKAEQTTASQRGHDLQSEGPNPLPGQGSALSTCPVQRASTQFTASEGARPFLLFALHPHHPSPLGQPEPLTAEWVGRRIRYRRSRQRKQPRVDFLSPFSIDFGHTFWGIASFQRGEML